MRLYIALTCLVLSIFVRGEPAAAQRLPPIAVRITPLVSGVDASFRGLAVRNEREAWVTGSGGTVIRTIDAGETWQRIVVPDADELDFRDVEILPGGIVVLMSAGVGKASRILRSTDAGTSWKTVHTNIRKAGFFDGMTFDEDGRTGVLFGDPIDSRLDLYRTTDGGATWQPFPEPERPVLKEGEYGFAASGTGIAMRDGNIWIATGGAVARIHHSADGGETWSVFDTPVRSGNESSGIFSIDLIDSETAIAVGGDYQHPELDRNNIARSIDGGRSWTMLSGCRMPHKACVRFVGDGRLLTCGRTGVAYSQDHGRNWKVITTEGYFTLAVDRRSGRGFLAGNDGRVARLALENQD